MRLAITLAFILGACSGDEVDEGKGLVCSMALYEKCGDEHDCESGLCKFFAGDNITVCSQACSADNPCPELNGAAVECNGQGICKPPAAIECRIPD